MKTERTKDLNPNDYPHNPISIIWRLIEILLVLGLVLQPINQMVNSINQKMEQQPKTEYH